MFRLVITLVTFASLAFAATAAIIIAFATIERATTLDDPGEMAVVALTAAASEEDGRGVTAHPNLFVTICACSFWPDSFFSSLK